VLEVATTDYHTAGEPFRIVVDGTPALPGRTVRERREAAFRSDEAETVLRGGAPHAAGPAHVSPTCPTR
jgi:proline racemase